MNESRIKNGKRSATNGLFGFICREGMRREIIMISYNNSELWGL